jgi:hypothetical protein
MQIIIDIKKEQDLQVLLPLLERLKIAYKSLPGTKEANEKKTTAAKPTKLSDKYAGKLSKEVGQELQKHIAQSRNEWERNI